MSISRILRIIAKILERIAEIIDEWDDAPGVPDDEKLSGLLSNLEEYNA